jgi:hypothetical protein
VLGARNETKLLLHNQSEFRAKPECVQAKLILDRGAGAQYLYINLGKEILKAVANAHNPSEFSLSCLDSVSFYFPL